MIIDRKSDFTVLYADDDKLLSNGQQVFKMVYIPKKYTDQEIREIYKEVDYNNFQLINAGVFTKLQLRRICRSLEIEYKLDNLLNSNQTFKKDWTDAVEIDLDDDLVVQALAHSEFTDQDIKAIRTYYSA